MEKYILIIKVCEENIVKKILLIIVVLIWIEGCASNSGVFRIGDNMYRISTRATWELGGRAGALRMALEDATNYCQTKRKVLHVIKSEETYGHFEGGRVDMTFSCEDKE